MPFSVRVNKEEKIITLVCWAEIVVDDLMEYERRFWEGSEHEGFHHIVDLQIATLKIGYDEGLMLATHATPVDLNAYRGARSAVVVATEVEQILADAYRDARHAMCSPAIREVKVFQDFEKARDWVHSSVVSYTQE